MLEKAQHIYVDITTHSHKFVCDGFNPGQMQTAKTNAGCRNLTRFTITNDGEKAKKKNPKC